KLAPECLCDPVVLRRWLRVLSGIYVSDTTAANFPKLDDHVLSIPFLRRSRDPIVAVPCFQTNEDSWTASVSNGVDPDDGRFFRLNRLVNHLLECEVRPDYFVLPECSLPRAWFDWFARRLSQFGISLIAGVEYLHWNDNGQSCVSNEVRMSLVSDFLG